MQERKYPRKTTYFIAYTNADIFGYGIVNSDNVMTTGQPLLYTTLIKADWLAELLIKFHTVPDLTK
jgi:hypothetical protein